MESNVKKLAELIMLSQLRTMIFSAMGLLSVFLGLVYFQESRIVGLFFLFVFVGSPTLLRGWHIYSRQHQGNDDLGKIVDDLGVTLLYGMAQAGLHIGYAVSAFLSLYFWMFTEIQGNMEAVLMSCIIGLASTIFWSETENDINCGAN